MKGGRRVLVTRPREGAEKTARRIAALGHEPIVLPLSRIVTLACPRPENMAFDAVLVTSANAVRHAGGDMLDALTGLPCLAVGDSTARAAGEAGFRQVESASGDIGDLAALAEGLLPSGARIGYLCGRVRRPGLEEALGKAGFHIHALETYDTEKVSYSTHDLTARLGIKPIDDVMVYSAQGATATGALATHASFRHLFEKTRFLCISQRVAEALPARSGLRVRIAGRPDEAALLALL